MPLYDFHCRGCGHEFEALVRAGGDAPACPACKSADLERLLSTFAMTSDEHVRELVKAERKKLLPKRQAEQREEEQHVMREHMDH